MLCALAFTVETERYDYIQRRVDRNYDKKWRLAYCLHAVSLSVFGDVPTELEYDSDCRLWYDYIQSV